MQRSLETKDRATLRLWRIVNVVGWSVLSLLLALFLRRGFEAAADLFHRHSLLDVADWLAYWEYALFVVVPSSVVCGLLIGSIVGTRVVWRPAWISSAVAAIYAVGTWTIMRSVPTPHAALINLVDGALVLLTVLVAVVVAARISESLPRVVRAGLPTQPMDE